MVSELLAMIGVKVDQSSFKKADGALKSLAGGFLKIAAIGAGVGVMLQKLTEGVAEHAREIQRTAQITGMTTDSLQGLSYAAKVSGVSAEELDHGLVHLARSAREATMGGGGAGLAYSQLGIRVSNATGKLRPLNEIFAEVAAKFSKMPDGTQKAALALQLFGRAGAQLIPLLDKGPAGLAEFTEEARKLGIVMDEKTLAAGNRYRVALERMGGAVEGLKNAIASRLFPVMTRATEAFTRWIAAHRQWIALKVEQGFRIVSQVLSGLLAIGEGVVRLFERIWKSSTTGKTVLSVLGVAVTAIIAPWMSLAAALALIAEDIEGYFEGKDSIIGRIIFAFRKLHGVKDFGIAAIFDDGLAAAKKLFAYVNQQLNDLFGVKSGGPVTTIADMPWYQQLAQFAGYAFVSAIGMHPDMSNEKFFFGKNAFLGAPGSQFAYPIIDGNRYRVDAATGAGRGLGPIHFDVNVVSHPGIDGTKVGNDVGNALVKHEDLKLMLREAHAASQR